MNLLSLFQTIQSSISAWLAKPISSTSSTLKPTVPKPLNGQSLSPELPSETLSVETLPQAVSTTSAKPEQFTEDNQLNIASFFSVISAIPQILNLIDQAVVSVEQSLQGMPGAQKAAAATAKLNGWLQAAQVDAAAITSLQGILGGLINAAVAAFNAAGLFHKATPPVQ